MSIEPLNKLELPSKTCPYIYGITEISFAWSNVVRTWNWHTGEEHLEFFSTKDITAIAKLKNEVLVLGDDQGRIFTNGSWISLRPHHPVSEILVVGPVLVIVEFKDGIKSLVNISMESNLKNFSKETKICVLKENLIALLNEAGRLTIEGFFEFENYSPPSDSQMYVGMRAVNDEFLLLKHEGKLTIYKFKDNFEKFSTVPIEWNKKVEFEVKYVNQFHSIVFLDSSSFILPFGRFGATERIIYLKKYSFQSGKWMCTTWPDLGAWKVTGLVVLNDHVMYVTTDSSDLHIFDKNSTHILSTTAWKNESGVNDAPESLRAFPNGIMSIKTKFQIHIFRFNADALGKKSEHTPSASNCTEQNARLSSKSPDHSTTVKAQSRNFTKIAAEISPPDTKKRCRNRLFIGEGDFSYTEAVITKHKETHPLLSKAIIATEAFEKPRDVDVQRIEHLLEKGVKFCFGLKAENIHEKFSKADRLKRIHWNCPYADAESMTKGFFVGVICDFFASGSQVQEIGDRIHVTLLQDHMWIDRQRVCPVYKAAVLSGYRLIKKRSFGKIRYPGYVHRQTNGIQFSTGREYDEQYREFIFEKIGFGKKFKIEKPHQIKGEVLKINLRDETVYEFHNYVDCSTDYDSSDYEDSDLEESSDSATDSPSQQRLLKRISDVEEGPTEKIPKLYSV